MAIGKKLEALLQAKGVKPGTLATKTGIPKNTIYAIIKRDNEMVNMGTLDKIASALGVSIDYFFDKDMDEILDAEEPTIIDELTEKERRFIEVFTALTPQNRHTFLVIAEALLKDQSAHPAGRDPESGT